MDTTTQAAGLDRVRALIAKDGWTVQGIARRNPLLFTVGLTEADLPELVIVGLNDVNLARDALNEAARGCRNQKLAVGDLVEVGLSVRFKVAPVETSLAWAHLWTAYAMYGDRVRALQLVWPDQHGKRPGDPGWSLGDAQDL